MTWRFLNTGERSGEYNMALDERLAQDLLRGRGGPTVRLFRWKPWAVSLGLHQSWAEIDQEKCRRDGIDVVRRPTGGRAILHARELTYSIVMFSGGKSILSVYNDIGRALVRGLRLFGVEADCAGQGSAATRESSYWKHISCFASSGRHEITVEGKKLVGSAQRRYGGGIEGEVVLQHGSILIGPEHRRLAEYITANSIETAEEVAVSLGKRTTELERVVGRGIEISVLSECIRRGFEEEWCISLVEKEVGEADSGLTVAQAYLRATASS